MNSHRKLIVAVSALLVLSLCAAAAAGQKLKDKKKDKRFEPVVKASIADYAGRYDSGGDYYLEITLGTDGQPSIVSQEGARRATMRNIRLTGARLTATRVYADGTTKEFEATFGNRIVNGDSRFGIRMENFQVKINDFMLDRVFYRFDSKP
ncbi:MAG TPA: hypothetical protein VER76_04745 [Pyrinomonadaceae bacterium]|nr:hypothetical protein [Pyrinomonadaceae bacterium]